MKCVFVLLERVIFEVVTVQCKLFIGTIKGLTELLSGGIVLLTNRVLTLKNNGWRTGICFEVAGWGSENMQNFFYPINITNAKFVRA